MKNYEESTGEHRDSMPSFEDYKKYSGETEELVEKTVHVSGSWYQKGDASAMMSTLKKMGYEIAHDWTTKEHSDSPRYPDQWTAIYDTGLKKADVVLISLENTEQRTHAATFYLYAMAVGMGKKVVVFDPLKDTRAVMFNGHPVHPAFHDLMGWSFFSAPNVVWVSDMDSAIAAL
jgi:hypothetical protein